MKTICLINLPFIKKTNLTETENFFYSVYQKKFSKISSVFLGDIPTYDVPEPPLWIAYLGAVLKDKFDVEVIDFFKYKPEDITEELVKSKLMKSNASYYLFSSVTIQYSLAKKIALLIKKIKPDAKIIIGGPHASFTDEECLRDGFDYVVRGEGEITTPALLKNLSNNKPINKIKGLSLIKNGNLIRTPDRLLIKNLNNLPLPAYELIPDSFKKVKTFVRVYCSRGCPYNCAFCADTVWKCRKPNYKSIKRIMQEVDGITSLLNSKTIYIGDESFTVNPKFVQKFCNEIKKTDYIWLCQTRVNHINKELVKIMKEGKCKQISFGAESASQKILNLTRKLTKVNQIKKACQIVKNEGLNVLTYWVCGLPGESKETHEKTIDYIKDLYKNKLTDVMEYYICVPYPGTPLLKNPEAFKVKIEHNKDGSYDWDKFREDSVSVMNTQYLTNKEIHKLWLKGLNEFAKCMEETK